jgi:hypothetical protein
MHRFAVFVMSAAVFACGGSKNNVATSANSAGTGTSTLKVTADVAGSTTSTGPLTNFQVDLRDGQDRNVSGATVTITNPEVGAVPLVETQAGSGRYVNSKAALPAGEFQLSVLRGTDKVDGVKVGGIGSQTVNAPKQGDTVQASQPVDISWTTPATAKAVSISLRGYATSGPDLGAFTVPAGSMQVRNDQRLTLSRYNEVDMAGALPGSRLRVTFSATVEPFIAQ